MFLAGVGNAKPTAIILVSVQTVHLCRLHVVHELAPEWIWQCAN